MKNGSTYFYVAVSLILLCFSFSFQLDAEGLQVDWFYLWQGEWIAPIILLSMALFCIVAGYNSRRSASIE